MINFGEKKLVNEDHIIYVDFVDRRRGSEKLKVTFINGVEIEFERGEANKLFSLLVTTSIGAPRPRE